MYTYDDKKEQRKYNARAHAVAYIANKSAKEVTLVKVNKILIILQCDKLIYQLLPV